MNRHVSLTLLLAMSLVGLLSGCSKDSTTAPTTNNSNPTVSMAASFSTAGFAGLSKGTGVLAVDSLRIDSAIVVLDRIRFCQHIDTVFIDTTEGAPDDTSHSGLTFRGPFIIHIRDTVGINFASQVLPAGTYDGIKFKIHSVRYGDQCEDSDVRNHHGRNDSTGIVGSSLKVWGSVYKNGAWTSFAYSFNGEIEFKLKGTFIVPVSTSTINLALNFNIGSWFVSPWNGSLLDPNDTSFGNLLMIRRAIYNALGSGHGGHDRGDGHPG